MHLRSKNTVSSGQRIAPEPASPCDGDLDTDIGHLIATLKNDNLCSLEQLNILHRVQAQLESTTYCSSQSKGPAPPLTYVRQYLKPKEAAAYLNSSASTLAKRRLYGGGPKWVRIGTAVRYRKTDLDAFMAASAVSSTSEKAGQ